MSPESLETPLDVPSPRGSRRWARRCRRPRAAGADEPGLGVERTEGGARQLPAGRPLRRFPALAARLAGVPADSAPRGSGPLERAAARLHDDRLALVGAAAGYIDAITGEGISLALLGAAALSATLDAALRPR